MSRKSYRVVKAGERTSSDGKPVNNKVLLATPDNEYQLMRTDLTYIDLPNHLSLHEPTQSIDFVYFPNRGMVSQVIVTEDGRTVEVGVVGNEGCVGVGFAVGLSRSSVREIVQISGDGFRMMGNALVRILLSAPRLQVTLNRHTGLQGMQVAQTAACNRLHNIQERLSRWLLMTQDRAHADTFRITQEFLALMLGVRRVGVTEAARSLQKRNLIHYSRGDITVLDRRGLKAASCGCYTADRESYDRILG